MLLYRIYKLSLFSVSLASLGEHLHFIAWPSVVINIWNGQMKTQPSISPFLSLFVTRSPTPTFNQGRKRLLLPPAGLLYFSSSTN